MPWRPSAIDWLSLKTAQDYMDAINALLRSNPVVSGSLTRPTGYQDPTALHREMHAVTQKELTKILKNIDAYTDSQQIQETLMNRVTEWLIFEHYLYQLTRCGPQPAKCEIYEVQVWRPASFYVVKENEIFDWKWGSPQRDFYEVMSAGWRHPAIVVGVNKIGLHWMVPCSHSLGQDAVEIRLKSGDRSYAKCNFLFKASWIMLCGDLDATDREGLKVTNDDFTKIRNQILNLLEQRRLP